MGAWVPEQPPPPPSAWTASAPSHFPVRKNRNPHMASGESAVEWMEAKVAWYQVSEQLWQKSNDKDLIIANAGTPRLVVLPKDEGDTAQDFADWLNQNRPDPTFGTSLAAWEPSCGYTKSDMVVRTSGPKYTGHDLQMLERIAIGYPEGVLVKGTLIGKQGSSPHLKWAIEGGWSGRLTDNLIFRVEGYQSRYRITSTNYSFRVLYGRGRGKSALSRWKTREKKKEELRRLNRKIGKTNEAWEIEDVGRRTLGGTSNNPLGRAMFNYLCSIMETRTQLTRYGWVPGNTGGVVVREAPYTHGKDAAFVAVLGYIRTLKILHPKKSLFSIFDMVINWERKHMPQPWRHGLIVPRKKTKAWRDPDGFKKSAFNRKNIIDLLIKMIPRTRDKGIEKSDIDPWGATEKYFQMMEDYYLHIHGKRSSHYESERFKIKVRRLTAKRERRYHWFRLKGVFHERKLVRTRRLEEIQKYARESRERRFKKAKRSQKTG